MKKSYFATALAAFALASCTSDDIGFNTAQDVIEAQQSNAIQFGTYMGKQAVTRAGYKGSMTTDELKANTTPGNVHSDGFGVFAYYTGKDTYNDAQYFKSGAVVSNENKLKANFMFNERVYWDESSTTDYITHWTYAPLKFWPNDFAGNDIAVDDADNDNSDNTAKGSDDFGGNVSFFAYAPYVKIDATGLSDGYTTTNTNGITKINGQTTLTAANDVKGDPTLTYVIAQDGDVVDLLWGTNGGSSEKAVGGTQNGVSYNSSATDGTYEKAILPHQTSATPTYDGYKLNADLTKQKTDGKVNFAFKHALAKVGGSEVYSTLPGNTTHGLMVVLDIDDMKGAEKGGTFNNSETKVTVSNITIKAKALVENGGKKPGDTGYAKTYLKSQEGTLNLATGVWTLNTESTNTTTTVGEAAETTHTINTAGSNGTLNTTIAEPTSTPAATEDGWTNGLPEGVLTTAKNVYESEAAPLVFIPGTYPELTITITYLVRTLDSKLAGAYSQVSQTISKVVSFSKAVELNKQYNLLLHLGLTGVKFTATVSDWEVNGDTNGNGTIDATETLVVTDTDLPINVGAATSTTVKAGTTATTYTAASNTSFAINLYGLTNGNTLECTNVSGDGIANTSAVNLGTIDASGNATATVTLTANSSTTATADNTVTIVEKNGGNVVSTTIVKITQLKAVTP
jgi:hypothetical protein